jgi:hypothetical protein
VTISSFGDPTPTPLVNQKCGPFSAGGEEVLYGSISDGFSLLKKKTHQESNFVCWHRHSTTPTATDRWLLIGDVFFRNAFLEPIIVRGNASDNAVLGTNSQSWGNVIAITLYPRSVTKGQNEINA